MIEAKKKYDKYQEVKIESIRYIDWLDTYTLDAYRVALFFIFNV